MAELIELEVRGHVAFLCLNDPQRLNVLTRRGLDDLHDAAASVEQRAPAIRALIIHGAGERAFCAGADVGDWGGYEPFAFARDWIRAGHRAFSRIARLPQPVVAAVEGVALGGGLELLAACDLRVASREARVGMPEARVGIVPGWSGTQRLARQLPGPVLRQMLFTGQPIDAGRAWSLGFINELVEPGQTLTRATGLAEEIAATAPLAVETSKRMLDVATDEDPHAAVEALAGGLIAFTEDKAEGAASFADKRPPRFSGK